MKGDRIEDGNIPFENGQYSKATPQQKVAEDGSPAWWVNPPPDGIGPACLSLHRVIEHEDGTISIPEGPSISSSSNSILITGAHGKQWHGYIDHGVWREC